MTPWINVTVLYTVLKKMLARKNSDCLIISFVLTVPSLGKQPNRNFTNLSLREIDFETSTQLLLKEN